MSKIPCPGFNKMFCYQVDTDYDNDDTVTISEVSNVSQCDNDNSRSYMFYFKDAENGRVSHADNTGGRFDAYINKFGYRNGIFKIK